MNAKELHKLLAKTTHSPQDVAEILCACQEVAAENIIGYSVPSDCICGRGGLRGTFPPDHASFQNTGDSARYALLATLYAALTGIDAELLERVVFVLLRDRESENA